MQQNCDLRTFNHQNPPQLMTFSVPRFCSSEGRVKLLRYESMLVMVSSSKGIAHAVINVNAVVSSHFLWIILGETGLELLKRGFFFFLCLFVWLILSVFCCLCCFSGICLPYVKKKMLLGFSKGLCLLVRVLLILLRLFSNL